MAKFNIAWNRRYGIISYARSSLWIVPVTALVAEIALKRLAEALGVCTSQETYLGISVMGIATIGTPQAAGH